MSEDCLNLKCVRARALVVVYLCFLFFGVFIPQKKKNVSSVFAPALEPANGELLPVMVWIHGGHFGEVCHFIECQFIRG